MRAAFERAVQSMVNSGVDALVLTPGADLFYLTGFEHGHAGERLLALVLRSDGSAVWIAPAMNVAQVKASSLPGEAVEGWNDGAGYQPALARALEGAAVVAFDDEARAAFLLDAREAAPSARFVRSSDVLRGLRIRKTPAELAALRRAGRTVDATIADAMSFCAAGRSETKIDELLRAALLRRSPWEKVAFTIIAGGPNGASPHHETADRRLQRGDLVILDFGTRGGQAPDLDHLVEAQGGRAFGYHSDITVTCSVGEPSDPDARQVYRVVYEAQQAAIQAIRPGARCEDIDRAARSVIKTAGYGSHFLHRTGHGLGLAVHEPPYLMAGNEQVLEEGMVFSIEPGIYLPERFGVRLEVIATVTRDGGALLNAPSARELPVINP